MPQFFISGKNIHGNRIYINDKSDIKHITKVLRYSVGSNLLLADGDEYI